MKAKLWLIGARPNLYMITDIANVNLETVDCSHYTRHIALKKDNQKKRTDMLAYTILGDLGQDVYNPCQ